MLASQPITSDTLVTPINTSVVDPNIVEYEAELMDGRRYILRSSSQSRLMPASSNVNDSPLRSYKSSHESVRKNSMMLSSVQTTTRSVKSPISSMRESSIIDRIKQRIEAIDISEPNTHREYHIDTDTYSSNHHTDNNTLDTSKENVHINSNGGIYAQLDTINSDDTETGILTLPTLGNKSVNNSSDNITTTEPTPSRNSIKDTYQATKQWINSFFAGDKPVVAKPLHTLNHTTASTPLSTQSTSPSNPIDLTQSHNDPFADYNDGEEVAQPLPPILPVQVISPTYTLQQQKLLRLSHSIAAPSLYNELHTGDNNALHPISPSNNIRKMSVPVITAIKQSDGTPLRKQPAQQRVYSEDNFTQYAKQHIQYVVNTEPLTNSKSHDDYIEPVVQQPTNTATYDQYIHDDNQQNSYNSIHDNMLQDLDISPMDLIVADRTFSTAHDLHHTEHCRMFIDISSIKSTLSQQQYSYRIDFMLQYDGHIQNIYQSEIQQKCTVDVTFKPVIVQCNIQQYDTCVCIVELYRWPMTALLWSDEPTLFGTCKTTLSAICNNVDCTKMPILDMNKKQVCMVTARRVAVHTSQVKIRSSVVKSPLPSLKHSASTSSLPRRGSNIMDTMKSPKSATAKLSDKQDRYESDSTTKQTPHAGYVSFGGSKVVNNKSAPRQSHSVNKSASQAKLRR